MNNKLRILIVSVVAILQLCAAVIMVVYSDNSGVSGNSPYDVVFDDNRYYQLSRAERTALCFGIQAGQIECTAPVPGGAERLIMMDKMRFSAMYGSLESYQAFLKLGLEIGTQCNQLQTINQLVNRCIPDLRTLN